MDIGCTSRFLGLLFNLSAYMNKNYLLSAFHPTVMMFCNITAAVFQRNETCDVET